MNKPIAAVVYEPGAGARVDALLTDAAVQLKNRSIPVAGATQRALERVDRCACDMMVVDLTSDREIPISEDRGPHAQGCRLDPQALEQMVGWAIEGIDAGARILIVNKFGKQEAEGGGFRAAIARALDEEIPVLIGVNRDYIEDWRNFAGELATELRADEQPIAAWLDRALALPATREPALG